MKIYRAVLQYNNGDYNEWERWYDIHSEWYTNKEFAEQHLPMLEKLADAMMHQQRNNDHFSIENPIIESQEVAEKFTPIEFTDRQCEEKKAFEEFSYIPYEGPHSISSLSLNLYSFPHPTWRIVVGIGEEYFEIYFDKYRNDEDEYYYISPCSDEKSNYYRYKSEDRKQLISICRDYAESILPYYKEFDKGSKIDDWDDARDVENKAIYTFLENSHIALSDDSVESIKYELGDYRGQEYPRYRESLERLLKFASEEQLKLLDINAKEELSKLLNL